MLGLLVIFSACSYTEQSLDLAAPVDLKVGEGFVDPIGYYEKAPRFSWQVAPKAHSQLSNSSHLSQG